MKRALSLAGALVITDFRYSGELARVTPDKIEEKSPVRSSHFSVYNLSGYPILRYIEINYAMGIVIMALLSLMPHYILSTNPRDTSCYKVRYCVGSPSFG